MPISLLGFIVGRLVAERQDLPQDSVNRAALIGATLGPSPVGVIATTEFIRREAPVVSTFQTPPVVAGQTTGAQTGGGSQVQTANSVYIPDLAKNNERITKEELETSFPPEIKVQVVSQPSIDRLNGRVLRQSHRDVNVPYGTTVTFYLGAGSGSKPMPDVENRVVSEARQVLEMEGFDIKTNLQIEYRPTTDENQNGKVLIQNPKSGTKVNAERTKVTLYVSIVESPTQTELREIVTKVQQAFSGTEIQQIRYHFSEIMTQVQQILSGEEAQQIGRQLSEILNDIAEERAKREDLSADKSVE